MRDDGLLGPGSMSRKIDREAFILLAGPAALLMQVAHPLVAAGVDQHSDFRSHPVGRLHRTLDTTLTIVFGDRARAERALRRIDGRHVPVEGVAADGRRYAARDPELLLWVQTTLTLTSLRLYELVAGPLAPAQRDAAWEEMKMFAERLGVPRSIMPRNVTDLELFERSMIASDVRPDDTSRALARSVLRPFGWLPEFLHWPSDAVTARLLPEALRRAYGLRWRTRDRVLSAAVIVALRGLRRVLPERLTVVPHARAYERAHAP